jgi:hypothetical protein
MPSGTNERTIVYVVDDDASMRGALESLFEAVELDTKTLATARDFLTTSLADKPGTHRHSVARHKRARFSGSPSAGGDSATGCHNNRVPMSVRGMKRGAIGVPFQAISRSGYA